MNEMLITESEESLFPWYALKVRTGSEPVAAAGLANRGYEAFLPVYTERRRYSDRLKTVERPAFPGYLFCRFDPHAKASVLSCPAVAYAVGFSGKVAPVPDDEIAGIRKALGAGGLPAPYLQAGRRVRIERGALAGVEGVLTRVGREDRITICIHLLQRAVAVQVSGSDVTIL
jgi:transcription termination/antitermination protein NusG